MGAGAASAAPLPLEAIPKYGEPSHAELSAAYGNLSARTQDKIKEAVTKSQEEHIKELLVEYSDDWSATIGDKMEKFSTENGLDEESAHQNGVWAMSVFTKGGSPLDGNPGDLTEADFPLSVIFKQGPPPSEEDHRMDQLANFRSDLMSICNMHKGDTGAFALLEEESESAPHLREYFRILLDSEEMSKLTDPAYALEMACDPEASKQAKERIQDLFQNECKPHLVKAFERHDTDNGGTLCTEEAKKLFENLTAESATFVKAIHYLSVMIGVRTVIQQIEDTDGIDSESMNAAGGLVFTRVGEAMEELTKQVESQQATYEKESAKMNAAAFKVLDSSGDGTIQLEEFLAAFEPESKKNKDFLAALGCSFEKITPFHVSDAAWAQQTWKELGVKLRADFPEKWAAKAKAWETENLKLLLFGLIDEDECGKVSLKQLKKTMNLKNEKGTLVGEFKNKQGEVLFLTDEELQIMIDTGDLDKDGELNEEEFLIFLS
jgi:Ca2+-binding EF-hand superfamily protein